MSNSGNSGAISVKEQVAEARQVLASVEASTDEILLVSKKIFEHLELLENLIFAPHLCLATNF